MSSLPAPSTFIQRILVGVVLAWTASAQIASAPSAATPATTQSPAIAQPRPSIAFGPAAPCPPGTVGNCPAPATTGCVAGTLQTQCFEVVFPSSPISPQCSPGFATTDWDSSVVPPNPLVPPLLLPRFNPTLLPPCAKLLQAELVFEGSLEGDITVTNNSTLSQCNTVLHATTNFDLHHPVLLPSGCPFATDFMQNISLAPNGGTASFVIPQTTVNCPMPPQPPLCFTSPAILANEFTVNGSNTTIRIDHQAIASSDHQGCGNLDVAFRNCSRIKARVFYTFCTPTPPDAVNDTINMCRGESRVINVLANDTSDSPLDCSGFAIVTPASNGVAVVTTDASCTNALCNLSCIRYTPNAGFTGTDTFTYRIRDESGCLDTATVTVNVCGVNTPNQTATVCAGGFVDICLPVSTSGTCPTPTCANVTVGTPSQGTLGAVGACPGSVTCASPGCCVRFTAPTTPSSGTATFTYSVNLNGCTSTGTVTVSICSLTAPNVTASVCAGGTVDVCLPITATAACGTITCANVSLGTPSTGSVVVSPGCTTTCPAPGCCVRFTAPGGAGPNTATFSYTVTSPAVPGCTATGTVTVNICRLTAPNVTASVCAGGTVDVCLPITASPACGTITCANVSLGTPSAGSVIVSPSCTTTCAAPGCCVRFTAPASGSSATFSYTVTAPGVTGCTATGTVTVNICSLTAPNVTASVCAGGTVDVCLPITASAACGTITCSNVTLGTPSTGTVAVSPSCQVACAAPGCCVRFSAPSGAGPNTATFSYTVASPAVPGCTATGTVTVNICRLTAPNVNASVCASGTVDICLPITASPACGTITCSNVVLGTPSAGSVIVSPSCTTTCAAPGCCVRFTAPATGTTATFSYTVTAPGVTACTATGTVTVSICSLTAPNVTASVCAGGTVDVCLPITASAACGTITCANVTLGTPSTGTVAVSPSCQVACAAPGCCVRFSAPSGAGPATATFSYTVTSPSVTGCSATGTVTVNICRLTAPNVSATVCANGTIDICLPITASAACGTITCANVTLGTPSAGSVIVSPSCTTACAAPGCCVRYTAPGRGSTATFSYTVTSPAVGGCTATGTVTVNICSLAAPNVTAAVCAGGTVDVCLPITATPACGTITCANVTLGTPSTGTVAVSPSCQVACAAPGCCVRFSAPSGAGPSSATFTYTVTSPAVGGCTATGTVTVNICRITAPNVNATVCAGAAVDICLPITTTAACGNVTCSNVVLGTPSAGSVIVSPSCQTTCAAPGCCVRYTAPATGATSATFTYTVTAPGVTGCTATGTVTVSICTLTTPNVTARVCSGGSVPICLPFTFAGSCGTVNCNNVTFGTPSQGTLSPAGACPGNVTCASGCCVTFNSPANPTGPTATFTYTVTSGSCTSTGTVTVTICRLTTQPDVVCTCQDTPITIDVLANDALTGSGCGAIDCDTLTIVGAPNGCGTATITPGCTQGAPCSSCKVVFTPAPGFVGACTFTYRVSTDGTPACTSTATVTVNVKAKPDAHDDTIEFDPTIPDPIEIDVLANDTPGTGCQFANPAVVGFPTPPAHGTVVFNPLSRLVEYTRGADFVDGDSFCYTLRNSCGTGFPGDDCSCEDTACVTISIIEPCPMINRSDCASLLLFPEFDNRAAARTLITVTDGCCGTPSTNVRIEVLLINKTNCLETNRTYVLTPCDTLSFLTSAVGTPNTQGYVYVFAKNTTPTPNNPNGTPIVFNHLIGQELVINGINSFQYALNAVTFKGLGAEGEPNDDDGDGIRDLNGSRAATPEYEQAPDRILIPRFLGQDPPGGPYSSDLILINLTGGSQFTTVVDALIWNDNEVQSSAQHQFYCWERIPLREFSGVTLNTALAFGNDPDEIVGDPTRESGWMQLNGAVAFSSAESILDPAIYAVLIEIANGSLAADLPFELCAQDNGDLLPRSLFGDGPNPQNGDNQ